MTLWIDRTEAALRLKVKPQTLYAYVSRGRIRMKPDPSDMRRSLYSAEDIGTVATRKARGRKSAAIAASSMDWGEPAIPTRLSTVHQGKLLYRGVDANELARTATLEATAALLWDVSAQPDFVCEQARGGTAATVLANMASVAPSILGRSVANLAAEAEQAIGRLAWVCGASAVDGPLHRRLATGWGCGEEAAEKIRQGLVLMADHDLNASTFAARVAASTGASLASCLLAGLCTLSGPRHGGAAHALEALLREAKSSGANDAIALWLARDTMLPGFGHNLYPDGDPRAKLMLEGLDPSAQLKELADRVFEMTGMLPNSDFGLAVMVEQLGLPADAPFSLFLLGRSVGWCAHAMEQNSHGCLIRPRGRYVGPLT